MSVFIELQRRGVIRVVMAYLAAAWLLLQIADLVFDAYGLSESAMATLVTVVAIGVVPAVVGAWVFEWTPEGIARDSGTTASPERARLVDRGIIVLLLLAVSYFAVDKFWLRPAVELEIDKSIAVLPFVNMSSDPEQEYFSDGISEELLNLLAKIPELQVAARTSSFSFKNQDVKLADVARELNVAHVLEGSVRKSGNEVRITAQLIKADDGFHMWSETWNRTLDDIFAIQDEIAADVVEQLQVSLLGAAPTVEETDPQAYALFLQARQLGRQDTAEGYERSNALYEHALEIESEYAAAWVGLAFNYMSQAGFLGVLTFDEGYTLAREAVNRALAINPEYAPAYAALGRIARSYDNDLAAAARHVERALELDPTNPDILGRAARLALSLGRLDEAIALDEYVVAHDPVNAGAHSDRGYSYWAAGRLDESIESYATTLSLSPGSSWTHYGIGTALLLKGEPEEALQTIQQETSVEWRLIGVAMAYHALGRAAESNAALAELIDKYEQQWAYNIANVLAYRGEIDTAFEWMEKAVQYKDPGLTDVSTDPLLANISDDPRWLPFLERIGKSPEQLAAVEFEVTLPQ